jgi:LysR family transcriptional regulator for bpeEF and oprC
MDRIEAMQIFVRVVEAGSFSKVSQMLALSPAKISRSVSMLEQRIGARLINRSTRRVSVTEDGGVFYRRCLGILDEISDAESSVANPMQAYVGTVNVETSTAIARWLLIPAIGDFSRQYPHLDVRLSLADSYVDLNITGADCAIRLGELDEAEYVARGVGEAGLVTCAAPSYLKKFGTPETIEELHTHQAITYISSRNRKAGPFHFVVDGETVSVPMKSAISLDDGPTYTAAGVFGYGIIQTLRFTVAEQLARGELVGILADYPVPNTPLSIIYPHRRNLNSRVRAVTDWVCLLSAANRDLSQSSSPPLSLSPCAVGQRITS